MAAFSGYRKAQFRRTAWSAHYKDEVIRLRMLAALEAQQSTDALVDQAFDKLA